MKLHSLTFILLVVGGLNWLLIGIFQWDLVAAIFGGMDGAISRIIYILVGLSAIYEIAVHKNLCKHCENKMGQDREQPAEGNVVHEAPRREKRNTANDLKKDLL